MDTAMQLLIKDFEAIEKDGYNIEPKAAIELCKQLLAKEKEQIMNAYRDGWHNTADECKSYNYFIQTFNK